RTREGKVEPLILCDEFVEVVVVERRVLGARKVDSQKAAPDRAEAAECGILELSWSREVKGRAASRGTISPAGLPSRLQGVHDHGELLGRDAQDDVRLKLFQRRDCRRNVGVCDRQTGVDANPAKVEAVFYRALAI